jgi:hypothetical protein
MSPARAAWPTHQTSWSRTLRGGRVRDLDALRDERAVFCRGARLARRTTAASPKRRPSARWNGPGGTG